MAQVELLRYAQVPGVHIAESRAYPVAGGELRVVPFDEWAPFVGRDVRQSERWYQRTAPVFYVDRPPLDGSEEVDLEADLLEPFRRVVTRLHRVLTFVLRRPLPDPAESTRYVLVPESGQRFRDHGPRDIEWMIYGALDDPHPIGDRAGQALAGCYETFEALEEDGRRDPIDRLLDVFSLAAEPGLGPLDLMLHGVIALEEIVNPDGETPLAEHFARRVALVTARRWDDVDAMRDRFRSLYRLRSSMIHGDAPDRIERRLAAIDDPEVAGDGLDRVLEGLLALAVAGRSQPDQALREAVDLTADAPTWADLQQRLTPSTDEDR